MRRRRTRAPLLLLALAGAWLVACRPANERPLEGAVVIVLDTLRADRLSAYGNARNTSPALDGLAARGVLFEQAVTPCSWTLPAMAALLAGREPSLGTFDAGLRVSLVERLREAGLQTAAFTEGGYVSTYFGIDRGFDRFEETQGPVQLPGRGTPGQPGGIEQTFARAEAWLGEERRERFFLLVHTYEVHAPYRRTEFAAGTPRGALGEHFELSDVERVRRGELAIGPVERAYLDLLYDGGVRAADEQVARLLRALDVQGLAERTLVVVTADHGEDLGERDARYAGDHGHALYEEQVRIPLIVFDPRSVRSPGTIRRVGAQVRLLDVMPTVLDLLGVAARVAGEGRSLAPLWRGTESAPRPALLRLFPRGVERLGPLRTAWRDGRHKLVLNAPFVDPPAPRIELYDLAADPGERTNLAEREPALRDALLERLRAETTALEGPGLPVWSGSGAVPEGVKQRLESLGYTE